MTNKHGDPDGLISGAGIPEKIAVAASEKLQADIEAFIKKTLRAQQNPLGAPMSKHAAQRFLAGAANMPIRP